jgi:hypothetical protein
VIIFGLSAPDVQQGLEEKMIVLEDRNAVIFGLKNCLFRTKNQIRAIVAKKRPKCPEM